MAEIPTTTNWTSSETASASGPVESSSKKEQVRETAKNYADGITDDAQNISEPKNEAKSLKAAVRSSGRCRPFIDSVNLDDHDDGGHGQPMSVDNLNHLLKAWEVFDKHYEVFQRKAEAATVAKPSVDKLIQLAEVASQSKDYASVIEELRKCLEIQKASFPADSRILAKTYYQLGVTFTFNTELKEAVCCFESALSVIQLRLQNLKNPTKNKPSMEKREMFYTTEGEIEDLETLLPHVRDKIAEAAITSSNTDAANGSMKSVEYPVSENPATNISHLIQKRN